MADQSADLTIRVNTVSDTKGSEAVRKSISDLGKETDVANRKVLEQNKTLGQAGQVAGRAAEQIGTVAGAMGAAGGAAGQAAAGVRLLSGAIQTMVSAGGGLAGLVAAIALLATSALVNWLVKVSAETKKLNEDAGKVNEKLTAMSKITLDAITSQQDKLRAAASGTADQYERILQAKNRMSSSQEQADLALLDYEKAVALSKADRSDPFAARRIEASFAQRAAGVSSAAERERQNNEVAVADARVSGLRGTAASYGTDVSRIGGVLNVEQRRMAEMRQRSDYLSANPTRGTAQDREDLGKDMQDLAASIAANTKALQEAQAKAEAARSQLPVAELDALTARTSRAALDLRTRATGREGKTAAETLDYDQRKAAEETLAKNRKLQEAARSEHAASVGVRSKEWNDVRAARTGGGDQAKELAEFREAAKKEQAFRTELMKIMRETKAETAKALEALRNLPNN